LDAVVGNTITVDLGGGHFAYYMHLQPGSLRVKPGDCVRRGQVLAGEGEPYLIDRYRCKITSDEPAELHTHGLPLDHSVVTFSEDRRN
jgi:septal ring factor EnvC (AmiA/AmiB activator)